MNLFGDTEPVINILRRIYKKNGKWIQTNKKYKGTQNGKN